MSAPSTCPSCGANLIDERCTAIEVCQTQVDEQVRIVKAEIASRENAEAKGFAQVDRERRL